MSQYKKNNPPRYALKMKGCGQVCVKTLWLFCKFVKD